ncbi:Peroxin 13, N-terminal region-domain-containing protein [Cytidiella melzeri]|nr:Peroxin 13, N-terminal region-domain-containing protein [Cytidiella melzeri]
MASPPKPWERAGTAAAATAPTIPTMSTPNPSTTTSSSAPPVPTRPAALTTATTSALPATSTALASTSYNSPYGYNSAYNRMGTGYSPYGMNSMYGGGIGAYGGGYGMGGYGGGYGMNGMYGPGMGMYGQPPFDPNNPSLTQALESSTQHTFALLQSIVQTFSGVSQMLESTFMATHSSFFAMVGVIDQFGQLRNALGSVLGLFGLIRWMRELVTGQRSSGSLGGEFRDFVSGRPIPGPNQPPPPKASKKPLIIFLLAIFGVPYAMHKLVKLLNERQRLQQEAGMLGALPGAGGLPPLDPSQLTFARALYPFEASSPAELSLKENEIVAVMGKLDPATGAEVDPRIEVEGSEWWKGRTREGREGWFPKKWVQIIERRKPAEAEVKVV